MVPFWGCRCDNSALHKLCSRKAHGASFGNITSQIIRITYMTVLHCIEYAIIDQKKLFGWYNVYSIHNYDGLKVHLGKCMCNGWHAQHIARTVCKMMRFESCRLILSPVSQLCIWDINFEVLCTTSGYVGQVNDPICEVKV